VFRNLSLVWVPVARGELEAKCRRETMRNSLLNLKPYRPYPGRGRGREPYSIVAHLAVVVVREDGHILLLVFRK